MNTPYTSGKNGNRSVHLNLLMIILLCGPVNSGKTEVMKMIVEYYGFHKMDLSVLNLEGTGRVETVEAIMHYIMSEDRWRYNHIVDFTLSSHAEVEIMRKRPMFYMIGVDAPLLTRFKRVKDDTSLEEFCIRDSTSYEDNKSCLELASIVLINNASIDDLRVKVKGLNLLAPELVRPCWDSYFMRLAFLASTRSNCMKRRVGAVLVKDNRVVSTGYNGTPRGILNCMDGGCLRCNSNSRCGEGLDLCLCMHAEENSLLEAGVGRAENCTIYTTSFPCLQCTKRIIQLRVKEVVYCDGYATDGMSTKLLRSVGINLRAHNRDVIPHKYVSSEQAAP